MTDLPRGWLSAADIAELTRIAEGKTVLELGAYKGRSTVVLAGVAEYVISVDRHTGVVDVPEDTLPEYLEAVRELSNVAIVVAQFDRFVPLVGHVDLVFIDGDHDYNSVERDIALALRTEPETVAFHDWDFAEVRDAAAVFFGPEPDSLGGSVASFNR